jgi:ATP-dependent Clp protease ATP-binding subunit ClpA
MSNHQARLAEIQQYLVGQPTHISEILDFVAVGEAGLQPNYRPAGVFLLAGPTGSGKTHTTRVMSQFLHGTDRQILRINCAEFTQQHEVARLIGAPPGYLGHRETSPMLSQQKVNAVASELCPLSIILLDEIEKASDAFLRIFLGILGEAFLQTSDGATVSFERSLLFMTSNLGAAEALAASPDARPRIYEAAVRKHFSPEFLNRIDRTLYYDPLTPTDIAQIFDLELRKLNATWRERQGGRAPRVICANETKQWLVNRSQSERFGAREINRLIFRHIVVPLAQVHQPRAVDGHHGLEYNLVLAGEGPRLVPVKAKASTAPKARAVPERALTPLTSWND